MAKEKQEPYEFLSNLVLVLMDMDRIFSNSFFTSELPDYQITRTKVEILKIRLLPYVDST